jgi:hypothetical protein
MPRRTSSRFLAAFIHCGRWPGRMPPARIRRFQARRRERCDAPRYASRKATCPRLYAQRLHERRIVWTQVEHVKRMDHPGRPVTTVTSAQASQCGHRTRNWKPGSKIDSPKFPCFVGSGGSDISQTRSAKIVARIMICLSHHTAAGCPEALRFATERKKSGVANAESLCDDRRCEDSGRPECPAHPRRGTKAGETSGNGSKSWLSRRSLSTSRSWRFNWHGSSGSDR